MSDSTADILRSPASEVARSYLLCYSYTQMALGTRKGTGMPFAFGCTVLNTLGSRGRMLAACLMGWPLAVARSRGRELASVRAWFQVLGQALVLALALASRTVSLGKAVWGRTAAGSCTRTEARSTPAAGYNVDCSLCRPAPLCLMLVPQSVDLTWEQNKLLAITSNNSTVTVGM